MAVNTSDIRGTVVLDPSALVPKDDGAKTEIATDPSGVLWVQNASGSLPVPVAGAGVPWTLSSVPAAATQATATRASAGATFRNVMNSLAFSISAVAAQGVLVAQVLDGAVVVWSLTLGPLPAVGHLEVSLGGLEIVGSVNTTMTIRFSGAPAATNFESVSATGTTRA